MIRRAKYVPAFLVAVTLAGCGRESTPTGPSGQTSFLSGTWRGTVTIQVSPGDPNAPPPSSGDMTWTFAARRIHTLNRTRGLSLGNTSVAAVVGE